MGARFDDIQYSQFPLKLQLVTLADELHRVETAAIMTWRQEALEEREVTKVLLNVNQMTHTGFLELHCGSPIGTDRRSLMVLTCIQMLQSKYDNPLNTVIRHCISAHTDS